MKSLKTYYVADLEVNNFEDDLRVWLGDLCCLDDLSHTVFQSLEEFVEIISKKRVTYVYFHNIKYDLSFVVSFISERGWKHYGNTMIHEREYKVCANGNGTVYRCDLYFSNSNVVHIIDSLKIIPMSVEDIGKSLGTLSKSSISFDIRRDIGYTPKMEEIDYVCRDTEIVARILKSMILDFGLTGTTIGTNAVSYYKRVYDNKIRFDLAFPDLSSIDEYLRDAYKGGILWVNKEYQNKIVGHGFSFDENSMYPDKMRNCLLPFGEPEYYIGMYKEDEDFPLYIQRVRVTCKVKDGYIPCIAAKNSMYANNELLEDIDDMELTLCCYDLSLLLDNYDFESEYSSIEYIDGYKFRATKGLFDTYVDFWYDIKSNSDGVKKTISKLMLNNLIGKFGTRVNNKNATIKITDGILSYVEDGEYSSRPIYLPIPIFANALARVDIMEKVNLVRDKVVYIDTDAFKIISDTIPECLEKFLDDKELGKYKVEHEWERARFVGIKKYIMELKDKTSVLKCSGLQKRYKENITIEEFKAGKTFKHLYSKSVKGGIYLYEGKFKIN